MSSSPNSSSSSDLAVAPRASLTPGDDGQLAHPFAQMLDVRCRVEVVLGTACITVRDCLALAPRSIVRLREAAGDDGWVLVSNVPLARAEVVVAEDRSAVRLTEILKPSLSEAR